MIGKKNFSIMVYEYHEIFRNKSINRHRQFPPKEREMRTSRLIFMAIMIITVSQALAQGTWTQYPIRIEKIQDIVVKDGELWCSSERRVFTVNPSTMEYNEIFNAGSDYTGEIEKSTTGDVLVGLATKQFVFKNGTWKKIQYSEPNSDIRYPGAEYYVPFCYDPDGICWMAGHGIGLIRFDGEKYSKVPDVEFLPDDRVKSIFAGSDGRIWIGTKIGLYCYDRESVEKLSYSKDNPEYRVKCIAEGSDGSIWIGTLDDGIFNYKDGSWSHYIPESNGIKYFGTGSLLVDDTGNLWASLVPVNFECNNPNSTLFKFDGETWYSYPDPVTAKLVVKSLTLAPDGTIWAGTYNQISDKDAGILQFDGKKWTNHFYSEFIPRNLYIYGLLYHDGSLLLATENEGLYQYDGTSWSHIVSPFTDARSVAVSSDNKIWVATKEKLYRNDDSSWKPFTSNMLTDNNIINQIAVGSDGIVWCMTKNGLVRFDGSVWKLQGESDGIPDGVLSTIAADPSGHIWLAWYTFISDELISGITVYDGEKWTETGIPDNSKASTAINKIIFGPEGEPWAVSYNELFRYDGAKWVKEPYEYRQIMDITCDSEGYLYIRNEMGVDCYNGESRMTYITGIDVPNLSFLAAGDKGMVFGVMRDGVFARFDPYRIPTVVDEPYITTPGTFPIVGNYPNPFNMSTTVYFELPSETLVDLAIFSVTGQKIRTLVSERKNPGRHVIVWDGRDDFGRNVSSGIYISRLLGGELTASSRMMLLK
ncbi:T9SS type A sorting domain-containing protein [bacterium]|nr:T9SS type A sorting domain-containing protein [bacterium]